MAIAPSSPAPVRSVSGGRMLPPPSTAPIYLRIVPQDDYTFRSAGCGTLNYCGFTITASAPQPNDVCGNAIDITTNNGGSSSEGDLAQASDEGGALPSTGCATALPSPLAEKTFGTL